MRKTGLKVKDVNASHFSSGIKPKEPHFSRIVIRLLDGASLLASDVETGKSDPVCFLFCAPIGTPEPDWEACGKALLEGDASHGVLMTKVCKTTTDPIWNEDVTFQLPIVDIKTILSLKCIVLCRDEDEVGPSEFTWDDLGVCEIYMKDVLANGKTKKNHIIDNCRKYDLQKTKNLRRIDGHLRITASIIFSPDDSKTLWPELDNGITTVEKFTETLTKVAKTSGIGNMDPLHVMKLSALEFRTLGSPQRPSSNSNSRSNSALRNSLSTPRIAPIIGVKPGNMNTATTTTATINTNATTIIDIGVPMLHIDEALNEEGSGIADEKSERLLGGDEYDWEDDGIPKGGKITEVMNKIVKNVDHHVSKISNDEKENTDTSNHEQDQEFEFALPMGDESFLDDNDNDNTNKIRKDKASNDKKDSSITNDKKDSITTSNDKNDTSSDKNDTTTSNDKKDTNDDIKTDKPETNKENDANPEITHEPIELIEPIKEIAPKPPSSSSSPPQKEIVPPSPLQNEMTELSSPNLTTMQGNATTAARVLREMSSHRSLLNGTLSELLKVTKTGMMTLAERIEKVEEQVLSNSMKMGAVPTDQSLAPSHEGEDKGSHVLGSSDDSKVKGKPVRKVSKGKISSHNGGSAHVDAIKELKRQNLAAKKKAAEDAGRLDGTGDVGVDLVMKGPDGKIVVTPVEPSIQEMAIAAYAAKLPGSDVDIKSSYPPPGGVGGFPRSPSRVFKGIDWRMVEDSITRKDHVSAFVEVLDRGTLEDMARLLELTGPTPEVLSASLLNRTFDAIATLLVRGIEIERCLMWVLALVRTKEKGTMTLGHTIARHTKRDLDDALAEIAQEQSKRGMLSTLLRTQLSKT